MKLTVRSALLALTLTAPVCGSPCPAAILTESHKLVADSPVPGSFYGYSTALSGDTAIVGAPDENNRGAAYIYQRNSAGIWNQVTRLSTQEAISGFGFSVAIDGDSVLVGSRGVNFAGGVYSFQRNSTGQWAANGKLPVSDLDVGDFFGVDVSLSGNVAVVGANHDSIRGFDSGAAYFYQRSSTGQWTQTAKVTGDDIGIRDFFGESVSIEGNTAVIGAFGNEAAYVFQRNASGQWSQFSHLQASDHSFSNWFGLDVSLDGDRIVIGAPEANSSNGAAYLFEKDPGGQWGQIEKFVSPNAPGFLEFGGSVAVSGDMVLVGDVRDDELAGAAFLFREIDPENWQSAGTIRASDAMDIDLFSRVALDGQTALVGAWRADVNGSFDSGAAYLYENVPEPGNPVLWLIGMIAVTSLSIRVK